MSRSAPPPPLLLTLEMTRARESWDPHAFAAGEQAYLLREQGGVYEGFEVSWDEALARDLEELSRPEPSDEVVWRLGERLRRILLLAGWERHDAAIGEAIAQGRRVIVDVLSAAAELYTLPWELVPLRSTGSRLAERPEVLIRYAWPATQSWSAGARPAGGRVLFAWSDAADPVPWEAQEQVIRGAVGLAGALAPLVAEVLPRASVASLQDALTRQPTLLHLLCHGRGGAGGGLVLHGPGGAGEEVLDAARLRALLAPAAGSLHQVVLCACGSGAWQSVSSQLGSLAQVAHRAGVTSVVAFRIPVSIDGANAVTRALYDGVLRELRSLEDAHLRAQQALAGQPTLDWAALQLLARAEDGHDTRPVVFRPYRGLLPFRREHRPFFFGRERVVREVVEELAALVETPEVPDLLFLAGASGVGKSSLLAAGVLPALEARWPGLTVRTMRPGAEPLQTLEEVEAGLGAGPSLLVIDQLEELFTHGAPKDEIARFAARLWALMQERVRCLAAIRGDFLDRLGEVPLPDGRRLDTFAYDDAHRVFIPRLLPEELRQAVAWPAAVVGLDFSPGLVERILEEVGHEPGALPLVQHCLDQLWERREGRTLTLRAYEQEVQGVHGALSRHADAVITMLQAEDRAIARRLLTELVAFQGQAALSTRRRRPLDTLRRDLGAPEGLDRVIAALVDARLLVSDDGDPSRPAFLEIAHEALIRRWPTLGAWLEEGAEARAARDWLRGLATERAREPGFVLRGAQLVAAQEVRERFSDELPADLVEFIGVSEAAAAELARQEEAARAAEQARIVRESRRARRTLVVSAVVLAGVVVLLVYAARQKRDAEIAEHKAMHKTEEARMAELRTAAAAQAEAKARQDQASAEEAKRKAEEDAAIAAAREAEAKVAMQAAEVQRLRAEALAQDAEELASQAYQAMEEARERAAALDALSRDLEIVQRASSAVAEDPTLAAALLREVQAEDPMQIPGWADLAALVLGEPLAGRVARGLPAKVTKVLREEGSSALVLDAGGRLMRWRPDRGGPPDLVAEGVLDVAGGDEDNDGQFVILLKGAESGRVCLLEPGARMDAESLCADLNGEPTRVEDVELMLDLVLLSSDKGIWWWCPEWEVQGRWGWREHPRLLGPVLSARWDWNSSDSVLVLTPDAPVRVGLDPLREEVQTVQVLRPAPGVPVDLDREEEQALESADLLRYRGTIDDWAQSAVVLREDLTETGSNQLWTFDLRPWRDRRGARIRAWRDRAVQRVKDLMDRLNLATGFVASDPRDPFTVQISQGAAEARDRGEPTTFAYSAEPDVLELLVGYSSGALERRDLDSGRVFVSQIDGQVRQFASIPIDGQMGYVVVTSDGAARLGQQTVMDPDRTGTWSELRGGGWMGVIGWSDGGIVSGSEGLSALIQGWSLPQRGTMHIEAPDAVASSLGWVRTSPGDRAALMVGMSDQSAVLHVAGDERTLSPQTCAFPALYGGCELVEGQGLLLRVIDRESVGFFLGFSGRLTVEELNLDEVEGRTLKGSGPLLLDEALDCPNVRAVGARHASLLAVEGCFGQWTLWDPELPTGQAIRNLPGLGDVATVQLSDDGDLVLAVTRLLIGGRLWRRSATGELTELRSVPEGWLATLAVDGSALYEAGLAGVRRWSLDGEEWLLPSPCETGAPTALVSAMLPDGEGAVLGCPSGEIYAVSGAGGEPTPLRDVRGAPVRFLQASPDGEWLVAQDEGAAVRLWALSESPHSAGLGSSAPILAVAFSPEEDELAWLDETGRLSRLSLADFGSLAGALWRATDDCLDVPTRVRVLGITEEEAELQIESCRERVSIEQERPTLE